MTRQSCSIFCHVLFNCTADAASLACLSISCTAGEQESHVMSEVEVQENKGVKFDLFKAFQVVQLSEYLLKRMLGNILKFSISGLVSLI